MDHNSLPKDPVFQGQTKEKLVSKEITADGEIPVARSGIASRDENVLGCFKGV